MTIVIVLTTDDNSNLSFRRPVKGDKNEVKHKKDISYDDNDNDTNETFSMVNLFEF